MNVTLKLPDDLVFNARHLALDEQVSLSGLVRELLNKKLEEKKNSSPKPLCWIDVFSGDANDPFLEYDLPLEDRKTIPNRDFSFDAEIK